MRELFVPTHRRPSTPGEILLEEFLKPLGVSQLKFAKQIGVGYPRKRAVTPDTAMRFSKALGTTAQFKRFSTFMSAAFSSREGHREN